jgi:hypothetical protein
VNEDAYEGSPVGALTEALGEGLLAGQVGFVVSRAGVGKSALLVHVALDALLREESVLHVAVRDNVAHGRAHYDEVFRAIRERFRHRDWSSAMLKAERHRMIYSYLDKTFDVDHLRQNLGTLSDLADFNPKLIVIDGLTEQRVMGSLPAIKQLAKDLEIPVWVSQRATSGLVDEAAWEHIDLALQLAPFGQVVNLKLEHRNQDTEALSVTLDPMSMLVIGEWSDPTDNGFGALPTDCTLYSGGARGAESEFGLAAQDWGVQEVNFTFEGHRQERTQGVKVLTEQELAAGDVSLVYVSRRLNRTYKTEGSLIRKVLQTLWHMVSRSIQVFVIGQVQEDGTVTGGTGWSVELARMWNKELWVYDQNKACWFRWDGNTWVTGEPIIHSIHFTGTGTRYLEANGQEAIRALFTKSFGPIDAP